MKTKENKNKNPNNKKIWLILGGLAILALFVVYGIQTFTKNVDNAPIEISVLDANKMRDDGAFILDVREPNEWEAVHIPGATLIPLGELENRISELPADQPIVVVCRSGNRSRTAANLLRSSGLSNVSSMSGGMNEWVRNSFEITAGP